MQRAVDLASADAKLFILSAAVERGQQADRNRSIRDAYNLMCKDFCAQNQQAHFVDIDTLLNPEEFADSDHYTRTGYFKIAEFVNTTTNKPLETAGAGQMNG